MACELTIFRPNDLGRNLTCEEFNTNWDSVEALRVDVCDLETAITTTNCIGQNADISYFYEPFCLFFDNVIGEDRFVVPTGTLDTAAVVKCTKAWLDGRLMHPTGSVMSGLVGNGFGVGITLTNLIVQLDATIGNPGAPSGLYVEGFVRKTLNQISGC